METNFPYLADWLSGKLSDQELIQMIGQHEFDAYARLRESLDALEPDTADHSHSYVKIKEKAGAYKEPKVIPLKKFFAIAATIILLFGIAGIFSFTAEIKADGESQLAQTLPDGSTVTIRNNGIVCHPALFAVNRRLKLEGEAYFEVKKGSTFNVITKYGEVRVLGTKFNVSVNDGFFDVSCFEGKVAVVVDGKTFVLTPTQGVRIKNGISARYSEENSLPAWLLGESTFSSTALADVVKSIENQYDVRIKLPASVAGIRFTGSVTNNDLETALKSVCFPNNLRYAINRRDIVISE